MTGLDTAHAVLEALPGAALIPLAYRGKRPLDTAWQNTRYRAAEGLAQHFNGQPLNVGVVLGAVSGGLVDVDLDCIEAITLAPRFLPPTMVHGRVSKPQSHRWYLSPTVEKTHQWH